MKSKYKRKLLKRISWVPEILGDIKENDLCILLYSKKDPVLGVLFELYHMKTQTIQKRWNSKFFKEIK